MNEAKQGAEDERVTLDLLKRRMDEFTKERDWEKFHSPRNLLLALTAKHFLISFLDNNHSQETQIGEVGELSEIFQWKGEVPRGLPGWKEEEKAHLGEELSDVLLYLIRLSDVCGVDLDKAVLRRIDLNAIKYPVTVNLCSNVGSSGESPSAER